MPEVVVSDQARGFVNRRMAMIHHKLGITHVTTPPYWPQANGLIERMVGTVKQVLRKTVTSKQDWDIALHPALFAINASRQKSSRFSAFWLMHGYHPRLPGELNIGTVSEDLQEAERLR